MHHPSKEPAPRNETLLLLRFPKALREALDREPSTPPSAPSGQRTNTNSIPTRHIRRSRRRRPAQHPWRRRFFRLTALLMLLSLLGGVALLEQRYRSVHMLQRQQDRAQRLQGTLKQRLARLDMSRSAKAASWLKRSIALTSHRVEPRKRPVPIQWPSWLKGWDAYLDATQETLWSLGGRTYTRLRQKLTASALAPQRTPLTRTKTNFSLKLAFQERAKKYATQQLQRAAAHLRAYQWCQMTWARSNRHRRGRISLRYFRKTSCLKQCLTPQDRRSLCTRCRRKLRRRLGMSRIGFQRYHQLFYDETRLQCHLWGGRLSGNGVFHIGMYYHHVNQALKLFGVLDQYKLCDSTCQKTRQQWGATFQFSANTPETQVVLRLWPSRLRPKGQTLRRLQRLTLGLAQNKRWWIPAIRFDLLRQPTPPSLWYLFYFYNDRNLKRAYLPVAPRPGKHYRFKAKLRSMSMHNDGRSYYRRLRLSPDGRFLVLARPNHAPWELPPQMAQQYCSRLASTNDGQTARHTLFVYPLLPSGHGTGKSFRYRLKGQIFGLHFVQQDKKYALLLSADRTPDRSSSRRDPSWDNSQIQAGLWKLPFMPQRSPKAFGSPTSLRPPQAGRIDLAIQATLSPLHILRLPCPPPTRSYQWLQQPLSHKDVAQQLPGSYRFLDATKLLQEVVVLMKDPKSPQRSTLWLRRNAFPLSHAFSQVRSSANRLSLAGGPWGTPLKGLMYGSRSPITLLAGRPNARYLDPVWRSFDMRLYVLQQHKILDHPQGKNFATFLLSFHRNALTSP